MTDYEHHGMMEYSTRRDVNEFFPQLQGFVAKIERNKDKIIKRREKHITSRVEHINFLKTQIKASVDDLESIDLYNLVVTELNTYMTKTKNGSGYDLEYRPGLLHNGTFYGDILKDKKKATSFFKKIKILNSTPFIPDDPLSDKTFDIKFNTYKDKIIKSDSISVISMLTHPSRVKRVLKTYNVELMSVLNNDFETNVNRIAKINGLDGLSYNLSNIVSGVQMSFSLQLLSDIIKLFLPPLPDSCECFDLADESVKHFFKIKVDPTAVKKTNLWFNTIYDAFKKVSPVFVVKLNSYTKYMHNMRNDQATMVMIYAYVLDQYFTDGIDIALRCFWFRARSKELSTILKMIGFNNKFEGAVLCETHVLIGRSALPFDMGIEINKRIGSQGLKLGEKNIDKGVLHKAILKICDIELGDKPVIFEDTDAFWTKRIIWVKNGGHSAAVGKYDSDWTVNSINIQKYRKMVVEHWLHNPLYHWNGVTFISASEKNECGKRRLLLAGDTVSYICFEHMLRPIEQAWNNKRVLLNPDLKGRIGISDRILKGKGDVFVATDYDDFNSQHSLSDLKMVLDIVGKYSGYYKPYLTRLIESIDNSIITHGGVLRGIVSGGLCSGHRITSFCNSILNGAYQLIARGEQWLHEDSLHTGDDSINLMLGYENIHKLLANMKNMGLKLNKYKQSIGRNCGEFLRMSVSKHGSMGYVARSISSIVSGNWEVNDPLEIDEYMNSIIGSVRSLMNRSNDHMIWRVFVSSVCAKIHVNKKIVSGLLSGRFSISGSPVFGNYPGHSEFTLERDRKYKSLVDAIKNEIKLVDLPDYGTKAYLSNHVSPVEAYGIIASGIDIKSTLKTASYAKSFKGTKSVQERIRSLQFVNSGYYSCLGSISVDDAMKMKNKHKGVLSRFPLIIQVKNSLSSADIKVCCELAGQPFFTGSLSLNEWAFGLSECGATINGVIPYSDSCVLSKKVGRLLIDVHYPICY